MSVPPSRAEHAAAENGAAPLALANPRYVGLVTRVVAIALDAAVINVVAILVEVGVALILSLLHLPSGLKTVIVAIGGAAYVVWTVSYFVAFWTATGQTPGNRVMQIRVVGAGGERMTPRRGVIRLVGMVLAALPLFLGYARILFDERRRGFHDRFAGTVVIEAPGESVAETRRAAMRAAYVADRSYVSGDDRRAAPADAPRRHSPSA